MKYLNSKQRSRYPLEEREHILDIMKLHWLVYVKPLFWGGVFVLFLVALYMFHPEKSDDPNDIWFVGAWIFLIIIATSIIVVPDISSEVVVTDMRLLYIRLDNKGKKIIRKIRECRFEDIEYVLIRQTDRGKRSGYMDIALYSKHEDIIIHYLAKSNKLLQHIPTEKITRA